MTHAQETYTRNLHRIERRSIRCKENTADQSNGTILDRCIGASLFSRPTSLLYKFL